MAADAGRDDEGSMRFRGRKWLVNIAHCSKLYTRVSRPGSGYWDDHLEMPWTGGGFYLTKKSSRHGSNFLTFRTSASAPKGDQRSVGLKRKSPPAQAHLFRHTVNKLAMDLSSAVVDNRYFKVLIVPKAFIAEVLRDLFAMFDRFSIRVELKADAISHRDAVFHIEKKLSHGQSSIRQ
jgi:hypothetical protein